MTAEETVTEAVENVAVAQAAAASTVATGVVIEKTSEAAQVVVAAAEAGAALATAQAAKVITENEGDMAWLKSSVATVESSLKNLTDSQEALKQQVQSTSQNQQEILTVLQSLTPQTSASQETPPMEEINPKAENKNENPEGPPDTHQKKKAKKRFI